MPTLPLHPAIVHLPLGLALALPLVALGLAVAVRRGRMPRTVFAIVVGLQALLVAGGAAAMVAGEADAERVEAVVGQAVVEVHEERAEAFLLTAGAVLAATVALVLVPPAGVTALSVVVVAGTLAVAALGLRVGHAGGQIVYQHGGATLPATAQPVAHHPVAHRSVASVAHRAGDDD